MNKKILPINLENLWENQEQKFTLRYKDINQEYQNILAKRIKEIAPQHSIKKENGPTIEKIEEILKEINPIIFSEYKRNSNWTPKNPFGKNSIVGISGYTFKILCKSIYKLTRKKSIKDQDIRNIMMLASGDYQQVNEYIEHTGNNNQEEIETPIKDFGMEDIERARIISERRIIRNTDEEITPDENYDPPRKKNNQRYQLKNLDFIEFMQQGTFRNAIDPILYKKWGEQLN